MALINKVTKTITVFNPNFCLHKREISHAIPLLGFRALSQARDKMIISLKRRKRLFRNHHAELIRDQFQKGGREGGGVCHSLVNPPINL